jgi:DNA-binding SARP family transcriptional activator/predicted ATPase
MPVLNLNLLGPIVVSLDSQPFYAFRTNKAQALLIYLALEKDRSHRREALMELLWPELPMESAQINLRQTLHRLRQALPKVHNKQEDAQVPLLLTNRMSVQLNPQAAIWLDVDEFQANIEQDPARALALYRGDFIANFSIVDSKQFEAWAESIREKLRQQALEALGGLTQLHLQAGDYNQAQTYAWRQLEIDRLHEPAYRQLMEALAGNGQRNAALSQYQICQRRLMEELGVEPGQETQALYEKIQADAYDQVRKVASKKQSNRGTSVLVFMLTDIENSTQLWDTYRESMLTALMQHNTILEKQIGRHGGRILELRGDGVKAVFEAGDPLSCVLAIQKDFAEADWGEIGAVKIRIGLHGVHTVRQDFEFFKEEDRYYGPVLNHTARIMDAGWGGQILVSEQIHQAFPLPPEASWVDFGQHTLKSLDQPVHIFGLTRSDLPSHTFPPLRTLSNQEHPETEVSSIRPRHNLTSQPTAFVGRKQEIAALDALLADPKIRLVTIVGPGGMGKTRLALAVAESMIDRRTSENAYLFPDGVFFVSFVSLTKPEQIIPAIAKALNVPIEVGQSTETLERASQTTTSQKEKLIGYLYSKRILLILDNLEHLMAGAEIVSELIAAAPTLQILVTSRERLHIREEQVYPIQGLAFPEWEVPGDLSGYTAIELFLQSARRLQPDFQIDSDDMLYLARICRLVGGMPLGLELAASWVDMLSVKEIAAEIQASVDFLESNLRNVPDRHRSIRAVFDSSWKRLTDTEKLIFARLSIFRGSFTRPAAESIAQASLRTLADLVSQSLLQYEQESGRYQIHELLRQYGAEQLMADKENEYETSHRHSAFYCAEVEECVDLLMSGQTKHAIDRLESDDANIRTAWDWAVTHAELDHVYLAINGICAYYDWGWRGNEALTICQVALDMLLKHGYGNENDPLPVKRLHVRILYWLGYFNIYLKLPTAEQYLDQSQAILDQLMDSGIDASEERCMIYFYQGWLNYEVGDLKTSKARFEAALGLSKIIGLQWMVLRSLMLLGDVARTSGAPSEAKIWYGHCLAESKAQGNRWGEIRSLSALGWAARSLMAYQEAQSYYEESLKLAKTSDNPWEIAYVLESLGFLYLFLGQFTQSIELFLQSVEISKELGMPYRTLSSRVHIGIANWLSGDFEKAETLIRESLSISQELEPAVSIFPTICLTEILALEGRYREAQVQIRQLETLTRDLFLDRFANGRMSRVLGWVALGESNYSEARIQFEKSIKLYQMNAEDEQIAWSQAGLARVAIQQGNWEEAHQLLIEALWTCIEVQGLIPLLFTLPMVSLFLARENPEQARFVYNQIQYSPFMADAVLFRDIVYQHLPNELIKSTGKINPNASENDIREILWSTASKVLTSWMQVWMEESEVIDEIEP